MSHVFRGGPPARDAAPAWVKEGRQPTAEELRAKHFADGGGMAAAPTNPQVDTFFAAGGEEAGDPYANIKVKRYNTHD